MEEDPVRLASWGEAAVADGSGGIYSPEVKALQLQLDAARSTIAELQAQLRGYPALFKLQNEEKKLRGELLYQWATHQKDVASGHQHLKEAVKLDKEERLRKEWGKTVSPTRPSVHKVELGFDRTELQGIRTRLHAAISDRAQSIAALLTYSEPHEEAQDGREREREREFLRRQCESQQSADELSPPRPTHLTSVLSTAQRLG
eukprot:Rhum_TRINITY_DN12540_c0_g1::Rhum_TRINITY_DN12540_c0_g1_i1::g.52697::m.52697